MAIIAIDGPAGAGKSTIARALAAKIGFIYVDTGALYRTVGLYFLNKGYDPELNCDIDEILKKIKVELSYENGEQKVFLNCEDVSEEIRTPAASMMASSVSAKPQVRAFLLEMQRRIARENNVIMDGRDIGTVVLPEADIKIFLTASAEIRARRRYNELIIKDKTIKYEDVFEDMTRRDYNDSHRAVAPLKPAEDSITVNTTGMELEQSVEALYKIVGDKIK